MMQFFFFSQPQVLPSITFSPKITQIFETFCISWAKEVFSINLVQNYLKDFWQIERKIDWRQGGRGGGPSENLQVFVVQLAISVTIHF